MSNRELANRIVSVFVSDEHLARLLPTPKKWEQLVDKVEQELESSLTPRAADGARFCPACHALLEEHSVYCDTCGTDTPRR